MLVMVDAAGNGVTAAFSSRLRIFRPPYVGCAVRTSSTACSIIADVRAGEPFGRRERFSSPVRPSAAKRASHLQPFAGLMPNRRHNATTLAPSAVASFTNSYLSDMMDASCQGMVDLP